MTRKAQGVPSFPTSGNAHAIMTSLLMREEAQASVSNREGGKKTKSIATRVKTGYRPSRATTWIRDERCIQVLQTPTSWHANRVESSVSSKLVCFFLPTGSRERSRAEQKAKQIGRESLNGGQSFLGSYVLFRCDRGNPVVNIKKWNKKSTPREKADLKFRVEEQRRRLLIHYSISSGISARSDLSLVSFYRSFLANGTAYSQRR